jgi:RNA polymerase sigma-70 factor (ECF subfamily)
MGKSREVFGEDLIGLLADEYETESDHLAVRRDALNNCLGKMAGADQELIERRYGSADTIQNLARERKTSVHKLYHSLERIRRALMECVNRAVATEARS